MNRICILFNIYILLGCYPAMLVMLLFHQFFNKQIFPKRLQDTPNLYQIHFYQEKYYTSIKKIWKSIFYPPTSKISVSFLNVYVW